MFIGAAIWLAIGASFGRFRARARYRSEYRRLKKLNPDADKNKLSQIRRKSLAAGSLQLLLWSILGIFSGISFVAWILLAIALTAEKEVKKSGAFDALIFSVIVFILGTIALDNRSKNFIDDDEWDVPLDPNEPRGEDEHKLWKEEDRRFKIAEAKRLEREH